MNYYLDTEFHEYHKQQKICGIKIGKAIPTIDLISIGIVSEDTAIPRKTKEQTNKYWEAREYYAISKDFNIKDAWNSWQWDKLTDDQMAIAKSKARRRGFNYLNNKSGYPTGSYWLRENVLKPIFRELLSINVNMIAKYHIVNAPSGTINDKDIDAIMLKAFNYKNFKYLINEYGKTNKQIGEEIKEFTNLPKGYELENIIKERRRTNPNLHGFRDVHLNWTPINFYAYYADYDWVVFCQLFGKMIDLPNGFPMYCKDLKQELDNSWSIFRSDYHRAEAHPDYPKQTNEHNALSDAIWNKELHKFITSL